ncbi:hypothetical protein FOZ62_027889, partial [Perkinsus olseni]
AELCVGAVVHRVGLDVVEDGRWLTTATAVHSYIKDCSGRAKSITRSSEILLRGFRVFPTVLGDMFMSQLSTNMPMDLLAFFLFGKLLESEPDDSTSNIVISPLSVYQTLAMAALGAKGSAADRIYKLTGAPSVDALLDDDYSSDAMLVVNSIWSNVLREDYVEAVQERLPGTTAYCQVPTASRINAWVDDKTKHLIDHILEEDPSPDGAVLVNAAYFKDSWKVKFNPNLTRPMKFDLPNGTSKMVPMMVGESTEKKRGMKVFAYYADDDFQVASVPYSHPEYSAVIALPTTPNGNPVLDDATYQSWLTRMKQTPGVLMFPKFKVEYGVKDLTSILAEGGLEIAGDYSGMSDEPLQISNVFHKAVLKVNEEGTEGAAATAMVMNRAFVMPPPEAFEMIVNRPFFFIVKHNPTGRIAFFSHINDPSGSDDEMCS